jgi:leucine dehydrogenase
MIAVAIHSSARGPAIGGCRIKPYRHWRDGVDDVLRLSSAMTLKCALADLPHGGGKTVAMLPEAPPGPDARRDIILDIAETIARLDGRYRTGPDIGSTPQDMVVIHGIAPGLAFCRPQEHGGSGNSSAATARGVMAALNAAVRHTHGKDSLSGLRVGVIGFGSVGRLVTQSLAENGATVLVSDVDNALRPDARRSGATWTNLDLLREDLDVLVPAAVGGLLTAESVTSCGATLIVGPANNQLADDEVALMLDERAITWVPDVITGAGGIIHAVCREELALDESTTNARIDAIGDKVVAILDHARANDITTLRAAQALTGQHD